MQLELQDASDTVTDYSGIVPDEPNAPRVQRIYIPGDIPSILTPVGIPSVRPSCGSWATPRVGWPCNASVPTSSSPMAPWNPVSFPDASNRMSLQYSTPVGVSNALGKVVMQDADDGSSGYVLLQALPPSSTATRTSSYHRSSRDVGCPEHPISISFYPRVAHRCPTGGLEGRWIDQHLSQPQQPVRDDPAEHDPRGFIGVICMKYDDLDTDLQLDIEAAYDLMVNEGTDEADIKTGLDKILTTALPDSEVIDRQMIIDEVCLPPLPRVAMMMGNRSRRPPRKRSKPIRRTMTNPRKTPRKKRLMSNPPMWNPIRIFWIATSARVASINSPKMR